MLYISNSVSLADWEIELSAIRSMGNGGQRVNKVATAIHLRFDIKASTLPLVYKERLLSVNDSRISKEGVIVIKAQSFRTQEMNKEDALARLKEIIQAAMIVPKKRGMTKPTKSSIQRRLTNKANQKLIKQARQKVKI